MKRNGYYKVNYLALILLLFSLMVLLPFCKIGDLVAFIQSGQSLVFLLFLAGMGVVMVFGRIGISKNIKFNALDLALLSIGLYYLINNYFIQEIHTVSFRSYDLLGLGLFYLFLRWMDLKNKWSLLVIPVFGGLVQVIYGELQLYGFYPSMHSGFPVTGSFFNPGPYAGFLAAVFPAALGLYLIDKRPAIMRSWMVTSIKSISLITVLGILLVLPVAGSRAAWLAVVLSGVFLFYHKYQGNKKLSLLFPTRLKKVIGTSIGTTLLALALFGVYVLKKDSADGRLLIWKASWGMIEENPLFGIGFDRFKAGYMEAQADYFLANPDDPAAFLADNVVYAFNESVQLLVEQGMIGFILVVILFIVAFRLPSYRKASSVGGTASPAWISGTKQYHEEAERQPNLRLAGTSFSGRFTDDVEAISDDRGPAAQPAGQPEQPEIWIAQAGLLSLLVFGMFSYPSHILPIKLCGVLYLAILARYSKKAFEIPVFSKSLRWAVSGVITILAVVLIWHTNRVYQATKDWRDALSYYERGAYRVSLDKYEKALPVFVREGDFLCNYGKALSVAGEHEKAVVILEESKHYLNNTIIQTALGDSYKALGMYGEAEEAYQLAVDMLPDRYYARYLLAKLYKETGQDDKWIPMARYLVEKEPKIPSRAVRKIREEMLQLIREREIIN